MIVREIREDESLLDDFDWFNDFDDTRQWAYYAGHIDLVEKLDDGFTKWRKKRNESYGICNSD